MSRNKNVDYTQYVHKFTDASDNIRYAVGEWSDKNAQFTRPLDKRERELTGGFAEFSRTAAGLGGYRNRQKALRRARYLYGPDKMPE
jgi:Arc/MetJ-type ribon-helix-helix transcriptional regulator